MPRPPKPTPARSRRAVPADGAARKRKPGTAPKAAAATPPVAPDAVHPSSEGPAPARLTNPTTAAPAGLAPSVPPDLELRDTRPFRERVVSRRGAVGLLLFRLGSETFAAELAAVEEAVEVPALHGLPEMRTGMLGMFELRGKLLPVFSASGILGVALKPGSTSALIVRARERRIGIAVDDVEDVIDADCAQLRNPPGGADADGVLLAILQRGTTLASVIDTGALLAACLAATPEHA